MTTADPRIEETRTQMLLRWCIAALSVAALHGTTAWAVLNWPQSPASASQPPAAVMIELSPLPVAPETPPQEVAVGPTQQQVDEITPNEAKDKPVEKIEPTPEPLNETAQTDPDVSPVKDEKPVETPNLDPVSNAEALLPPPPPKPPEPKKEEEKTLELPKEKIERKIKPQERPKSTKKQAMAPKAMPLPKAHTNAASVSGTSSSMSTATWRGMVMAHLERFKRYPGGGGGGTSSIAFTIDRSGRVLSARLIRSSGSNMLDQEAAALPRRASPVPPPPGNTGGGTVLLTVPIRFSR